MHLTLHIERIRLSWLLALTCLAADLPAAPNPAPQSAARYHFAGSERVGGNTNLATFHRIAALPATAAFRNLAMDKAAALLAVGLGSETRAPAKSLLNPLLADLWRAESLGAFSVTTNHVLDFVLAIRLEANRARFWQEQLARILGGPGEEFTVEGCSGRRWGRAGGAPSPVLSPTSPNAYWVVPARNWLLVGRGDDLLALQAEYVQEISRQSSPASPLKGNVLEAEVDLSQLAPWLPEGVGLFKPARLQLTVAAKVDHFHLTARAVYAEAIPWTAQRWQMPTELVRGPLISFTAGQDLAAFLNFGPAFSQIDHNPLTNQFCAWALGEMLFQTYMAWPVPNASNALQTLSTQAPRAFNASLTNFNHGKIVWVPERARLLLANLGVMGPWVEAAPANEGQFLLLSLFPLSPANKPAPAELWTQIEGRSDLVCYDWEATGPRLQQWQLLSGMLWHSSPAGDEETTEAAVIRENWLSGLASAKGNAVTVMTRVAPKELSIVRSAPLGLTGIELVVLSDWISRCQVGLAHAER